MVWKEQIASQNIWWKHGQGFDQYDRDMTILSRSLLQFQRKAITPEAGKIYTIRGPRRAGKTVWMKTMIRELLKHVDPKQVFYLSCDTLPSQSREQLGRAISIYKEIAEEFPISYLFLDEITYLNDWEKELKGLVESGNLSRMAIIVTGSSPTRMKKQTEYLPGRGVSGNEFLLKPLSFRDFVIGISRNAGRFRPSGEGYLADLLSSDPERKESLKKLWKTVDGVKITLEEGQKELRAKGGLLFPYIEELQLLFNIYQLTGGFPHIINDYLRNADNKQKAIDSRLYEDTVRAVIGEISKLGRSEEIARQILLAITKRMGSHYSYSALTRDIAEGISHPTLIDYVSLLEDGFILHTLPAHNMLRNQESPKMDRKIYPIDPFILYSLQSMLYGKPGYDFTIDYLNKEENEGKIVESIVVTHLARVKEVPLMGEPRTFLWFSYNRNGEIDCLLRRNDGSLVGLEVKYQQSAKTRVFRHPSIRIRVVVTRSHFDYQDETVFMPACIFLAGLVASDKNL